MYQVPLKNGEMGEVPWEWISAWASAYSNEFVAIELRKAVIWNIDNVAKRKTKRGLRRHLGMWLARAWEKSGGGEHQLKELS